MRIIQLCFDYKTVQYIVKGAMILCIKIFYLDLFAASYKSHEFDVKIDALLKKIDCKY